MRLFFLFALAAGARLAFVSGVPPFPRIPALDKRTQDGGTEALWRERRRWKPECDARIRKKRRPSEDMPFLVVEVGFGQPSFKCIPSCRIRCWPSSPSCRCSAWHAKMSSCWNSIILLMHVCVPFFVRFPQQYQALCIQSLLRFIRTLLDAVLLFHRMF